MAGIIASGLLSYGKGCVFNSVSQAQGNASLANHYPSRVGSSYNAFQGASTSYSAPSYTQSFNTPFNRMNVNDQSAYAMSITDVFLTEDDRYFI